jgi:hypothetical protein
MPIPKQEKEWLQGRRSTWQAACDDSERGEQSAYAKAKKELSLRRYPRTRQAARRLAERTGLSIELAEQLIFAQSAV